MDILETPYGRFHIYVNYMPSHEEDTVHLSFVDKNNKTHIVLMKQSGGQWLFSEADALPDWITNLQEQFNVLVTREILRTYHPSIAKAV